MHVNDDDYAGIEKYLLGESTLGKSRELVNFILFYSIFFNASLCHWCIIAWWNGIKIYIIWK